MELLQPRGSTWHFVLLKLTQLIQPVQFPLQSLPSLQQISNSTQLGVICKLTESALDPLTQIIDKDIK